LHKGEAHFLRNLRAVGDPGNAGPPALLGRYKGRMGLPAPDAGQAALLPNPRLVLPPQLDRLALCSGRNGGGNQISEVL